MSKKILDEYIKKKEIEIYQDILINDELYKKGVRNCNDRYECIKNMITIKTRRFTVLDIGSNFGFYPLKILKDFPNSFVVMIQPYKEGEYLKEICKLNTKYNDRLILLNTSCNSENMRLLSECEHFDYIICNNVLHHFKNEWESIYNSIKNMCKYLIIETPPPNDNKSCGQQNLKKIYDLVNKECNRISDEKFIRHTNKKTYSQMYFYTFNNIVEKNSPYYNFFKLDPHINKSRNINPKSTRDKNGSRKYIHDINDDIRIFIKPRQEVKGYRIWEEEIKDYIHGINLYTFIKMNGIYPEKKNIINNIKKDKLITEYKWDNSIKDINIWNMILNEKVYLIDVIDRSGDTPKNDKQLLNNCVKQLQKFIL